MAHRFSEVNNCPNCRNKLWFRKVKQRYFYNCLNCGYEQELEKPKTHNPPTDPIQLGVGYWCGEDIEEPDLELLN